MGKTGRASDELAITVLQTRRRRGGTEFITFDGSPYDLEGSMPLEAKKGTCIVLDGMLPHYSLPNTSARSRQAYTVHTIDGRAHYPDQNWLQRNRFALRSV